ncbi:hypothetical protein D1007_18790 [Hordeum vulgare]|nr:hypothetical protein D1007_18790 [Hordeum vulgare]
MAGGSSSKRFSSQKASSQEAWLGSDVGEEHIEALRHHRLLPPASQVLVRLPGAETAPTPVVGEVVVFTEHSHRGFGLPASAFFSEWVRFFGLQPHHLAPNAILQLSAFVILCEGFVGIEPRVDQWCSLFFFKQQSIAMEKSEESIKQWQKGFFYVKNADPAQDALNMPPFNIDLPTRLNWAAKTPKPIPEVALICAHLEILEKGGLLGRDLLTTMVTRRILPLQRRPHPVIDLALELVNPVIEPREVLPNVIGIHLVLVGELRDHHVVGVESTLHHPLLHESLQGSLHPPAPDVDVSDASEIEDEGMIESRSDSSAGSENPLESEGKEPSAFEEDSDGVEEVTSPPLTRGQLQRGGATATDEAAGRKGKGATASRPAIKRPAPGPPAGTRAGATKKRRGAGRRQVPMVAGEAEDVEEDTASGAERAGWAAADAAERELEKQSKRRWDVAAGKTAVVQFRPSRLEKPAEKRAKARHDPSAHARAEEPASEAASRHAPRAEAAPNAPELILNVPDAAPDVPGMAMDAPGAAPLPPVEEAAPTEKMAEPAAEPAPGASTIVVPHHGPVALGAGGRVGSRPMKTWRAANLARLRLPAGTALTSVPELVSLFTSGRSKVEQSARVVCSDMEGMEARTQAYNEVRTQHLAADGQIAELEVRLGEVATERDALCGAGNRLQEQLALL